MEFSCLDENMPTEGFLCPDLLQNVISYLGINYLAFLEEKARNFPERLEHHAREGSEIRRIQQRGHAAAAVAGGRLDTEAQRQVPWISSLEVHNSDTSAQEDLVNVQILNKSWNAAFHATALGGAHHIVVYRSLMLRRRLATFRREALEYEYHLAWLRDSTVLRPGQSSLLSAAPNEVPALRPVLEEQSYTQLLAHIKTTSTDLAEALVFTEQMKDDVGQAMMRAVGVRSDGGGGGGVGSGLIVAEGHHVIPETAGAPSSHDKILVDYSEEVQETLCVVTPEHLAALANTINPSFVMVEVLSTVVHAVLSAETATAVLRKHAPSWNEIKSQLTSADFLVRLHFAGPRLLADSMQRHKVSVVLSEHSRRTVNHQPFDVQGEAPSVLALYNWLTRLSSMKLAFGMLVQEQERLSDLGERRIGADDGPPVSDGGVYQRQLEARRQLLRAKAKALDDSVYEHVTFPQSPPTPAASVAGGSSSTAVVSSVAEVEEEDRDDSTDSVSSHGSREPTIEEDIDVDETPIVFTVVPQPPVSASDRDARKAAVEAARLAEIQRRRAAIQARRQAEQAKAQAAVVERREAQMRAEVALLFKKTSVRMQRFPDRDVDFLPDDLAALQRQFNTVDADGAGTIDKAEFCHFYKNYVQGGLKRKEVEAIFDQLDEDGGGTLDFEEFTKLYGIIVRHELKTRLTAKGAVHQKKQPSSRHHYQQKQRLGSVVRGTAIAGAALPPPGLPSFRQVGQTVHPRRARWAALKAYHREMSNLFKGCVLTLDFSDSEGVMEQVLQQAESCVRMHIATLQEWEWRRNVLEVAEQTLKVDRNTTTTVAPEPPKTVQKVSQPRKSAAAPKKSTGKSTASSDLQRKPVPPPSRSTVMSRRVVQQK